MAAPPATSARWLFGPIPDLMLGCGGLYACVLLAFSVGGAELRAVEAVWLAPLLVLVLGAPHYGATLLRVYEHRSQRRLYAIFSLWATLAVLLAFGASLFHYPIATLLVTVYLSWSPWHYTGQNYGLAMMFAGRRSVPVSPLAKRLVYASFMLSFALTFLLMHSSLGRPPVPEFAEGRARLFTPIGIPDAIAHIAFPALLLAYSGTLIAAGWLLTRTCSLRDLVPSAALVATQALWFTVPLALQAWRLPTRIEPFEPDLRQYYFFWIALGHSTQYLWITTYYARRSTDWGGFARYLGKVLLAGTAIWTLPAFLLDPGRVSQLPNAFALGVLVAAAVNIHHFILDGAIWKLRDTGVGSILLRNRAADAPASEGKRTSAWLRRAVWTVAAFGCFVTFFNYALQNVAFPRAMERNDFEAARRVLQSLDWAFSVRPEARSIVEVAEYRHEAQLGAYARRLDRQMGVESPAGAAYRAARKAEQAGDWAQAALAYEQALARDLTNPTLLAGAAKAWLELGRPRRALPLAQRWVVIKPGDEEARAALQRAREMLAQAPPG